jgi:Ring finger domain
MMSSTPADDELDGSAMVPHRPSPVEDASAPTDTENVDADPPDVTMKLPSNGVERVGLLASSLDMASSFNRWLSSNKFKRGALANTAEDHPSLYGDKDCMDLQTPLPLVETLEHRSMRYDGEDKIHPTLRRLDDSNRPRSHSECWHRTESSSSEEGSMALPLESTPSPNSGGQLRSRAYTADPMIVAGGRLRRRFSRCRDPCPNDPCTVSVNNRNEDEYPLLVRPLPPTTSTSSTATVRTDGTEELYIMPVTQYGSEQEAMDEWIFLPSSRTERAPINATSRSSQDQVYSNFPPSARDFDDAESSTSILAPETMNDRERRARMRWIRINRRFQIVIAVVAVLLSLLLFSIVVCWIVLTVAVALSWDQDCDVPLKPYYWLVTLQLILDVFRSDIMRFLFRWDHRSSERIPGRVVAYNCVYILYALLVLRLGVNSTINPPSSSLCHETAPRLFHASLAFVSLTIAVWATIICGYAIPFVIVAILLTVNGYNPYTAAFSNAPSNGTSGTSFPVMPTAFANTGAPPGCVDQLRIRSMDDWPSTECCICMEVFSAPDIVVETNCGHVFHQSCCREWLRQSRTCPVCRDDIPSSLPEAPPRSRRRPPESRPDLAAMERWRHVWEEATRHSWHDRTVTTRTHHHSAASEEDVSTTAREGTIRVDDTTRDVEVGRSSRAASVDLF